MDEKIADKKKTEGKYILKIHIQTIENSRSPRMRFPKDSVALRRRHRWCDFPKED